MLDTKRNNWDKVWQDPYFNPTDILQSLQKARTKAAATPLPPLTDAHLLRIAGTLSPRKATGVDALTSLDIRRLPRAGRADLIHLLHAWERVLALPWQLLLVLIALLPKPDGSDRAIGLAPWLLSFWCALRA